MTMNKKEEVVWKGKNAARERKKEENQAIEQVRMECLMCVCQISTCRHNWKEEEEEEKCFYFHKAVGCGAYIVGWW